jgi:peroxiredoxin
MIQKFKNTFIISLLLWSLSGFSQEETTLVKLNQDVPDFTFESAPGKNQSISTLKGKTVLITFFATWCSPCRKELPHIQSDIYDKYKNNKNFELLIFGREHTWDEVNKFKKENKFTMSFYPDVERKIYSKFATQFIPRNFLVSPEGKVIFSSIGFEEKDFDALKKLLTKQLK